MDPHANACHRNSRRLRIEAVKNFTESFINVNTVHAASSPFSSVKRCTFDRVRADTLLYWLIRRTKAVMRGHRACIVRASVTLGRNNVRARTRGWKMTVSRRWPKGSYETGWRWLSISYRHCCQSGGVKNSGASHREDVMNWYENCGFYAGFLVYVFSPSFWNKQRFFMERNCYRAEITGVNRCASSDVWYMTRVNDLWNGKI